MKYTKLLLTITILLIPFVLSAKKPKKKDREAVQSEVEATTPAAKESATEKTENIEEIISKMLAADSATVIETKAITPTTATPIHYESTAKHTEADHTNDSIPASHIYPFWSNEKVNPYEIRLENTEDTISIDVSTFCFPLPQHYRVTSEFGFRRARHHYGIDLKLNIGDSVVCAFDGMVRIAKTQKGGYGKYVVVRHYNGLETVYGHFNKILVTEGQYVKAGELLGEGGNTGRSTGPHLHFEMRYLGQAINPRDVVNFADDKLCCHSEGLCLTKTNFEYIKEVEAIKFWKIKSGDTLSRIASKTGVSISRLCALNNIKKTSILRIGQQIRYN